MTVNRPPRPLSLLPIALLAACVASGTQVTQSQLQDFRKGETTLSEVTARLGRPSSSSLTADGKRAICYIYIESKVRPETLIPIVGVFAGGADSRSDTTCLQFDAQGVLAEFTSTTSQAGAGYGIESTRDQ